MRLMNLKKRDAGMEENKKQWIFGRLLAKLYKENKVGRYRHYCENWQDGYPKWFYVYYSL